MSKIAFISSIYVERWGGSEELWSRTAAHLVRGGTQVVLNAQQWQPPVAPVQELIRLGCKAYFRSEKTRMQRLASRFRRDTAFDWLERERPDLVVVAQGSHMDGWGYMRACAQRNLPFVTIAQAAYEGWWPDDATCREIGEVYEQALACYFVSESNLALTRRQLAVPLNQGKVVRNPFQVAYDARPSWPDTSEGYKLACVGRLEPKAKGQDLIFEVLAQEKWRRRPVHLTLYGKGMNEQNLRDLKNLYALDNVTFGGFVPDIAAVWQAHHALLLPSRYEGLPLALVEAMLCARPCIVTDVAGNRELIEDGAEGFLAAAPQPRYVDDALERAWARRGDWQEMGQAAARKARGLVPCDPIEAFARELLALLPAAQRA